METRFVLRERSSCLRSLTWKEHFRLGERASTEGQDKIRTVSLHKSDIVESAICLWWNGEESRERRLLPFLA